MRARLLQWLTAVVSGLWFAPTVMLVLTCVLAHFLLGVDQRLDPGFKSQIAWTYSGGPEGARSVLSTIAGSMITATSITFTLASVALSISSQQYGSRVLRNFIKDRLTQVLSGSFVSSFVFSVLVVRAIRGSDISGGFVPSLSVTVAIAFSLASLILLIFFIHHLATSIQASHILRVIGEDLDKAIPKMYPSQTGAMTDKEFQPGNAGPQKTLRSRHSGYLQTIDLNLLTSLATKRGAFMQLLVKPGDHLVKGCEVVHLWGSQDLDPEASETIVGAFQIGRERTPTQDIRFHFQQLTDVVVRALSPGINDPFTAVNGIDELSSAIQLLSERTRTSTDCRDPNGVLRLKAPTPGIGEILDITVAHIAIYAAGDRFVMAGLRRVLEIVLQGRLTADEKGIVAGLERTLDRRQNQNASGR